MTKEPIEYVMQYLCTSFYVLYNFPCVPGSSLIVSSAAVIPFPFRGHTSSNERSPAERDREKEREREREKEREREDAFMRRSRGECLHAICVTNARSTPISNKTRAFSPVFYLSNECWSDVNRSLVLIIRSSCTFESISKIGERKLATSRCNRIKPD